MNKRENHCNKNWIASTKRSITTPKKNKELLIENKNSLMRKSESLKNKQLLSEKQEKLKKKQEDTESKMLNGKWTKQENNIKICKMSSNSIN